MQNLKNFKNNSNQVVAFAIKKTGSDIAPPWFRVFADKVEKFMVEQKQFNKSIVKLNNLKIH